MTATHHHRTSESGSALILAITFAGIISAFLVPAVLKASLAVHQQADRKYYNIAAYNIAESGIERGIQALRSDAKGSFYWDDWDIEGTTATIKLPNVAVHGEVTGTLSIVIQNYSSGGPRIISKAEITDKGITKYMYADLSGATAPGLFAYGLLSRDFIKASGGVVFDSWDSDPDNDPETPFVPYSSRVANDNIGIASTSTADGAISLGSSAVYGTASVGGSTERGISVGWGGQVGPKDDSEWDSYDTEDLWRNDPPGWKVSTKTGALTQGFTATFEEIVAPDLEVTSFTHQYQLPYTARVQKSNKWSTWYSNEYVDEETIGKKGETTILELSNLVVDGGAELTIEGNVTIIMPRSNSTTLKVVQGGQITLAPDAHLTIYVAGDVELSGAGIFSQAAPQQFQIWGTATAEEGQKIELLNNAQLNGLVYAPYADFKVTGNSDLCGSIVCNSVELTGSGSFRYDEALRDYSSGSTSSSTNLSVNYVQELNGEERDPYLDLFNF